MHPAGSICSSLRLGVAAVYGGGAGGLGWGGAGRYRVRGSRSSADAGA
jgi:hypothetical protein